MFYKILSWVPQGAIKFCKGLRRFRRVFEGAQKALLFFCTIWNDPQWSVRVSTVPKGFYRVLQSSSRFARFYCVL